MDEIENGFKGLKQNSNIYNLLQSIFAVRLQTDLKIGQKLLFWWKKFPKFLDKSDGCGPPVDFSAIWYLKDMELTLKLLQISIKITVINYNYFRQLANLLSQSIYFWIFYVLISMGKHDRIGKIRALFTIKLFEVQEQKCAYFNILTTFCNQNNLSVFNVLVCIQHCLQYVCPPTVEMQLGYVNAREEDTLGLSAWPLKRWWHCRSGTSYEDKS